MADRNRIKEYPLDPVQRKVVQNAGGQTILRGGPGTGKTHCLVGCVAALLDSGASPESIAVFTGSPQAVGDLRNRLAMHDHIADKIGDIFVGTVDQGANDLLRRHTAPILELPSHYSIWDRTQAEDMTALGVQAAFGARVPTARIRRALQWHWTNGQRDPDDREMAPHDDSWPDIARVYVGEKKLQRALDVEDLSALTVRQLEVIRREMPGFRYPQYRHILVDQAEDLTGRQAKMLELMADPHGSLLVVNDVNQGLEDPQFEWVGRSWRRRFGGAQTHRLTISQSGTRPLSEMANALKSSSGQDGLTADQQDSCAAPGSAPRLVEVAGPWHAVVGRCLDDVLCLHGDGVPFEDIAVLYRNPGTFRRMKTVLTHRNVPYRVLEEPHLQRPTDARWIVAMLTAALNPLDLAAVSIASVSRHSNKRRRLPDGVARNLLKTARAHSFDLVAAAGQIANTCKPPDSEDLRQLVQDCRKVVGWLDDDQLDLDELLTRVAAMVLRSRVRRAGHVEPETRWLLNKCLEMPFKAGDDLRRRLQRFLDLVSPALGPDGESLEASGLTFSTIAAAKGRQWKVVMCLDARDQTLPGKARGERLRRERRMFYTAITRATDCLYLYCQADTGQGNAPRPTRFLDPVGHLMDHDRVDAGEIGKTTEMTSGPGWNPRLRAGGSDGH